ncbi:hypothetical protein [Streptomyces thermolilacinus]|uniref:Lipoprotein n=1 Tax=Streptomyces thermolilacinus SPC6 TaxID=1306406 RepID=A0A1D3DRE0_9ACTN|nr:hypothetical protein [Streptomyces thermolilacinus]OEJ94883.1 hypothetical protein J116_010690 [Streptomyces thermolilacinus SPC6]
MKVSVRRRLGVSTVAVAVLAALAGCQSGDGKSEGKDDPKKAADAPAAEPQWSSALQVIQTAYEKTAAAKSAKVRMTMTVPAGAAGAAGEAGTMEMSGVMGWEPGMMDITMKGSSVLGAQGDGPDTMRMIMVNEIMYMHMGDKASADLDGKEWLKLDFKALAAKSGDAAVQKQLTGGLDNMNQDPAKQLALLLDSPNLKHIGPEKIDGVEAQHYKGSLTVEEMLAANKSLSVLSQKQRDEMVAKMKQGGLTSYDTEVWVNKDGYPVKMDVGMQTPAGKIQMSATYSDYGTKAAVQAPPPAKTFDFMEMMEKLSESMKDPEGAEGATA